MKLNEINKRIISSFILLPAVFYLIIEGSVLFNFFLIIILFLSIYEFFEFKLKKYLIYFGIIYLLISFYTIFLFRNANDENSLSYFFIVFITCISTDLGGYLFGKIFKGPKITKISPNKTYSGVLGSYVLVIISIYFFLKIQDLTNFLTINFLSIVLIISTISQLGDLLISYFKRKTKIKDSGTIIPGHGGILDRIDGMIFAFPMSYLIFY